MNNIGTVYKSTGSFYIIKDENGNFRNCVLKGKIRLLDKKTTNPIAVGDLVEFEVEDENTCVIKTILPRKNYIIRKATRASKQYHVIASNLDLAVLIFSVSRPKVSLGFIDRFLLTAEAYGIPVLLVINKIDLLTEEEFEYAYDIQNMYTSIGYETILTSTFNAKSIDLLREKIQQKTTLFSGFSGVGKSSLLNELKPNLGLRTGEISDFSNKGKHTTTFAEMFELPEKTLVIDTPGIKEMGIIEISSPEVSKYFKEMLPLLSQCKYNNCLHVNEPQCAVIKALEAGEISQSRYINYLSILEDDDSHR